MFFKKELCIVLLLALGGCCKYHVSDTFVHMCEARLSDVPIVLNAKIIKKEISSTSYAYYSYLTFNNIISFYRNEMERFGWQLMAQNEASQTMLVFEKPSKVCTIMLAQAGSRVFVRIDYMRKLTQCD